MRRNPVGNLELRRPAQLFHQSLATLLAVQQQHGILATGRRVSGQQGLELQALIGGTGVGIGQRARGAHGGAGAATHAQVGVHLDLLTALVAGDGFGRADVHAGIATHGFVAAVGAELLLVGKELGLFELAHQLAQAQQRAHFTPVPAEIALGQRVLQKGGGGVCRAQIEHQIEALLVRRGLAGEIDGSRHLAHLDAGAVRLAGGQVDLVVEPDGVFGAGGHAGVAACAQVQVNRVVGRPLQLKGSQPAREARDAPAQHRKTPCLRPARVAGALGEQRDIQHIGHQRGRLLCCIQRADDEQPPSALERDGRHRGGFRQMGGGQQRRYLGAGLAGVAAPATRFADVHETDRRKRAFGLLPQVGKQPLFLRAGHHNGFTALDRTLECAGITPAQGGMKGQVFMQCLAQRFRVEGHRLVAVADQRGHVVLGWQAGPVRRGANAWPSPACWVIQCSPPTVPRLR